MATFSLATLRARAQQESDLVNSDFVATTGAVPEWTQLINGSYLDLYGQLVTTYEDYFVANPFSIVTDGINNQFALPSDFFKLRGVDLQVQGANLWVTLKPFNFPERNRFQLVNSPAPMSGQTLRLWYVPVPTPLAVDADLTVDIPGLGYEEFIVLDAALKALDKEESDVSVKMARRDAIVKRIEGEAANRDAGEPSSIVDHYAGQSQSMRYHLMGGKIWFAGGQTPAPVYGEGYFDGWGGGGYF